MTLRKKIVTLILVVLLGGLGFFGYAIWRHLYVTMPNAYAVWNTADHINDFMDAHDGAWPRGWSDLRKTYENSNRFTPEHWADLEARVNVDWNADPRLLAKSPEPTDANLSFRVVWLKSGSHSYWSGAEPNWLIWIHLQQHPATSTQPAQ